jgi:hypothetical protein
MTEPLYDPDHDTEADSMVETPESLRDGDPESPPLDRGLEATDRPLAAESFGTTNAEAEQGESLDDRLAQEVPDTDEPGGPAGGDARRDSGGTSAEEAAVRVEREP